MTPITRTYITGEEYLNVRYRDGFTPVESYGEQVPEHNEVGAIVIVNKDSYRPHPSGLYTYTGTITERFFLKEET